MKKCSLILVVAIILNMLVGASTVSAATTTSDAIYLIQDFEDGTVGNSDGGSFNLVDGPGVSTYAVNVPNGNSLPEFGFGLRSRASYDENGDGTKDSVWSYDASAWIRVDGAVTSDKVDFIFTLENAEASSNRYYPATVEETVSVSSAGLVQGQWVKVSKNFTYDGTTTATYKKYGFINDTKDFKTNPVGTVKVKVSGGVAYTMDDLVIMPKEYTPIQQETVNSMFATQFSDLTEITSKTRPWYVGDSSEIALYNDSTQVTNADGVAETVGKAVTVTNSLRTGQVSYAAANFKYGVTYQISFFAKAENDEAKTATPLVRFDRNIGTTENPISKATWVHFSDGNLTSEWKKYTATFTENQIANPTLKPYLIIHLHNASDANDVNGIIQNAKWSIAGVKVSQVPETKGNNLIPRGTLTGNKQVDGTLLLNATSSSMVGESTNCISQIQVPYGDDYVIYKSFDEFTNDKTYLYSGDEDFTGARLVIQSKDLYNDFGRQNVIPIEMAELRMSAVAEFNQTVWAPDMPSLSATIRYRNANGSETLMAICSMYDNNNKMVSKDIQDFSILEGNGEITLTVPTTKSAKKAKIFLWEEGTYAPRRDDIPEIAKTNTGHFIYVDSKDGVQNTTYGYENPVETVNQAVAAAESLMSNAETKDDIYIILHPGRHIVDEQINITNAMTDPDCNVRILSYDKHNKGIISGGVDISTGFTLYQDGIYQKQIGTGIDTRQLFVNGERATRARTKELEWGEITNPTTRNADNTVKELKPMTTASEEWVSLAEFEKVNDLEFIFFSYWTMPRCQVDNIVKNDDGSITINMDNPGWSYINDKSFSSAQNPAYIENAIEFLDEPGEWYYNSDTGYIYYMPRSGESINDVEMILPILDNLEQDLINISGAEEERVSNLTFDNVSFAHTTWTRPSTAVGHADAQNNTLRDKPDWYYTKADRLADEAIDISYANNLLFTGCEFTKLGINGVRILRETDNCSFIGNEFYEIAGTAINVGDVMLLGTDLSTEGNITNTTISNNYIHHTGRDYWSSAAIGVTWAENTLISNNELAYFPYSGLHLGWGWEAAAEKEKTDLTITVKDNYIHDCFQGKIYDGGAIYTLGLSGGTDENPNMITGNYVEDVGPGGAAYATDEGSTGYYFENNVADITDTWEEYDIPAQRNRENAFAYSTQYGDGSIRPHNLTWKNTYASENRVWVGHSPDNDPSTKLDEVIWFGKTGTWCDEARTIMANAGIQENYIDNFRHMLQELKVGETLTLNVGETVTQTPAYVTSKGDSYCSKGLTYTATSDDTNVVKVENGTITAVGVGTATITYATVENGIRVTAKTTVTVS